MVHNDKTFLKPSYLEFCGLLGEGCSQLIELAKTQGRRMLRATRSAVDQITG
jgi:hypothetical protein